MKRVICLILIVVFISMQKDTTIQVNKEEAKKAFALLQAIRKDPNAFSQELKFKKNLNVSKITLKWNDTLAKVAENRAYDMASKNYFSHTSKEGYGVNYYINKAGYSLNASWLKSKSSNFFESIAANQGSGENAIKALIIDEGLSEKGHRNHLLGLDEWNSSLTDIGIGYVTSSASTYKNYMVVIIAKHDF